MTENNKDRNSPGGLEIGLGGLVKGLGDLVAKLGELAETGEELSETGETQGPGKQLRGIYGFTANRWLRNKCGFIDALVMKNCVWPGMSWRYSRLMAEAILPRSEIENFETAGW